MTPSRQAPEQLYDEQFATSDCVDYGNDGKVLFGLKRLELHAARLAVAWLQGGWDDDEVSEILATNLVEVVIECAGYIEGHRDKATVDSFSDTWEEFLKAAKRLDGSSEASPEAVQPMLVLLPIAASVLASAFLEIKGLPPKLRRSSVDPSFFERIKNKADELGCGVDLDTGAEATLAAVTGRLRECVARLA